MSEFGKVVKESIARFPGRQEVRIHQKFSASPNAVFEQVTSPALMSAWAGIKLAPVAPGKDAAEPFGEGCVRKVTIGPSSFEETVLSFDRPASYTYTISKGSPLKNYLGRVDVFPVDGGCEVWWTISFDAKLPVLAPIIAILVYVGFSSGLSRLAKRLA
ncbi:MAG: SRPBCC family protein [Thermodesulfobacteriota bacterium]